MAASTSRFLERLSLKTTQENPTERPASRHSEGGAQSFFLPGSQPRVFKDLRPPLTVGRADAGRAARRNTPPRPAAARASRARSRATRKWPQSRRALIGSWAGSFGAAGARAARTAARAAAAAAEPAGAEGGRRKLAPGQARPRAPLTRDGRTPRGRARAGPRSPEPRPASPRPTGAGACTASGPGGTDPWVGVLYLGRLRRDRGAEGGAVSL